MKKLCEKFLLYYCVVLELRITFKSLRLFVLCQKFCIDTTFDLRKSLLIHTYRVSKRLFVSIIPISWSPTREIPVYYEYQINDNSERRTSRPDSIYKSWFLNSSCRESNLQSPHDYYMLRIKILNVSSLKYD